MRTGGRGRSGAGRGGLRGGAEAEGLDHLERQVQLVKWLHRPSARSPADQQAELTATMLRSELYIGACVVACFTISVECALSGLYIDNGVDQTVIHHTMTRNERLVVEHEILELLGLGERPRRPRSAPPLDRAAAPSFLLDVYKQLLEEPEQTRPTRSSELTLTGDEQQAIDESDLIMSFQSKSEYIAYTFL